MNVYDFDKTIYYPGSSVNFGIFVMNHHPHLWLTFFPGIVWTLLRYKLGKVPKAILMRKFFRIMRVKDFDRLIENFYSDSLSDTPIALCAEKAYLVVDKAQRVIDWPKLNTETIEQVRKEINSGWNIQI